MTQKKKNQKPKTQAKLKKPAAPKKLKALASAPKAPAAKPSAKSQPLLSVLEIKEIKKHLQASRSEIIRRLQEKKSLDMPEAEVGDPIDQASQSLDKEVLFEVTDKDQLMLEQVEAALRRIEKNVYGMCESCRSVIPTKRLKALPFARYCVNCQSSNESASVNLPGLE